MSKHSRKKHHKRAALRRDKAVAVICQRCGTRRRISGHAADQSRGRDECLLRRGPGCAAASRRGAGRRETGGGYVLPLPAGDGDRWTARTLTFDPFIAVPAMPDDLDD